jgi:hypothetical protein
MAPPSDPHGINCQTIAQPHIVRKLRIPKDCWRLKNWRRDLARKDFWIGRLELWRTSFSRFARPAGWWCKYHSPMQSYATSRAANRSNVAQNQNDGTKTKATTIRESSSQFPKLFLRRDTVLDGVSTDFSAVTEADHCSKSNSIKSHNTLMMRN